MKALVAVVAGGLVTVGLAGCFGSDTPAESSGGPGDDGPRFGPFEDVDLRQVEVTHHVVESFDGTELAVTTFVPPHANESHPVPVILNLPCCVRWTNLSQGQPMVSTPGAFTGVWDGNPVPYLEAGFVVVSQDHRGQGDSEGTYAVHHPDIQGRDTAIVLDWIAERPYVALDGPGDPVVGTVGVSGGAMGQTITALYEIRETGQTRIDALAPANAPWSMNESLGPNGVPRSAVWATFAQGVDGVNSRMDPGMGEIGRHAVATGSYPDGTAGTIDGEAYLWARSSQRLVQESGRIDVPMLSASTVADAAVPLHEAIAFYYDGLTPSARNESLLMADYRGVHQLAGIQQGGDGPDACDDFWGGEYWAMSARFHRKHLLGEDVRLGPPVQLATTKECLLLDALPDLSWFRLREASSTPTPATTRMGTMPNAVVPAREGPFTLAGIPRLNATVSEAPLGGRVFIALAAGETRNDIRILADQWMPMQVDAPGTIEQAPLAGMAATVEGHEQLFIVVARWVDQFFSSRESGSARVILEDIEVGLPVVDESVVAQVTQQHGPDDPNLESRP